MQHLFNSRLRYRPSIGQLPPRSRFDSEAMAAAVVETFAKALQSRYAKMAALEQQLKDRLQVVEREHADLSDRVLELEAVTRAKVDA